MKASVSRTELVSLIGKIQGVVSPKPPIAILGNILIEAANGELTLSASDLMISLRGYLPAKITEEGAITLPARKLFQLVRELTTPQVDIETTAPETAIISSGSSHFKIQGVHKTEFPAFPDLSNATELNLSAVTFREMLLRSAFSAAREDNRQVLNGILFQPFNNILTLTGTDGKRLAKIETSLSTPKPPSGSYIIPLKAVEELIKVVDGQADEVKLFLSQDKIGVELDRLTLISKLLNGQYPDVSRIIPKKSGEPISLHREELITLLRQVSLFTSETSSAVRFCFQDGTLHLSAMSGEVGEGKVSMPAHYNGPKFEIAFNPHFFLDILRHSKDETIQFYATDPYNPGLVTDSSSAQFVIMPMRLE